MSEEVAEYLRCNPDFLRRHPDLLAVLEPPGRDESGVVDLQRVMVERERRNNSELRLALRELLEIGASNQAGMARVHKAALAAAGLRRLAVLTATVSDAWPDLLSCDRALLAFETRAEALPAVPGLVALAPGQVELLIGPGTARLEGGLEAGPSDLFGDRAAEVASMALLRLDAGPRGPAGLLALSSRDPEHFEAGQGSELLSFLAGMVSAQFPTLIDPPQAL